MVCCHCYTQMWFFLLQCSYSSGKRTWEFMKLLQNSPPAPQFWATTSLHINSAVLNRPKTTVFSLSLSQHSFSHSIIISLPNRFPGKGLLNTANSQSNALLAPWTETTTNCANGHSMGDKRAYPPPPPLLHIPSFWNTESNVSMTHYFLTHYVTVLVTAECL